MDLLLNPFNCLIFRAIQPLANRPFKGLFVKSKNAQKSKQYKKFFTSKHTEYIFKWYKKGNIYMIYVILKSHKFLAARLNN